MINRYIHEAMTRHDHHSWVIVQQVLVRGILALKFLLAARLLGPEQIGLVGVALFSLAIVESLSDTGLSQAIVQKAVIINSTEAGAVWTLLLCRGLALSALLLLAAIPISSFFEIHGAAPLIAVAAVIPLLRNSINPGYFLVQRACNFRDISIYESASALIDFSVTMLLLHLNFGAISLLLGNIANESLKLLISWLWFRTSLRPNFNWKGIHSLISFGKWIWSSSLLTLVLNQLDKVLIAKFLGPTEFGLYQVAARIAQLVVTDGPVALGQYLYPNFSKRFHASPGAAQQYFKKIMLRLVPIVLIIAILLAVLAKQVIIVGLGMKWLSAAPVLRVMVMPMFLGAVIAVLVPYLRAIGKPRYVTEATLIQLIILLVSAPFLLYFYGAIGMACSLALAGSPAVYFMFRKSRR